MAYRGDSITGGVRDGVFIPFGKYKGKRLDQIGDDRLESLVKAWSVRDEIRSSEIYDRAVDELVARKELSARYAQSVQKLESRIPSGPHQGKRLSDLTDEELQGLQGSWWKRRELEKHPFFKDIQQEVGKRGLRVLEPGGPKGIVYKRRSLAMHHMLNYLRCTNNGVVPIEKLGMVASVLDVTISELKG